jgi:hypothetical protein
VVFKFLDVFGPLNSTSAPHSVIYSVYKWFVAILITNVGPGYGILPTQELSGYYLLCGFEAPFCLYVGADAYHDP